MLELKGSITALVTPFKKGALDEEAFARLIERQLENGTHGLVPVGSTGEAPTVSHEEHRRLIDICVEVAGGRAPVIAGAGSNSTREAIGLAEHAAAAGADAILCATGYYNKPSQAGLYEHYRALSEATALPVVVYNVPGRTVVDISDETLARLSALPGIIGLKDASGDLARVARLHVSADPNFTILSGEDITAVGLNAMGGRGCISVTANVCPKECAQMQEATLAGDFATALSIQDRLTPLHDALFADTNPGPVKYALSRLGLMEPDVRRPLALCPDEAKAKVDAALKGLDLL